MASITLRVSDRFPAGTSVGAYPASARVPGSSPSAAVVETETVQTDGTLTFTALVDNAAYVAYANVGGQDRYVSFGTQHENQASLIDTSSATDGQVATWDSGSEALVLRSVETTLRVQRAAGSPLDAAGALTALIAYPVGTVLYECTDVTDETTIYAEWVKANA